MIHPKYSPEEALKRMKLMMEYDSSKTLSENKKSLNEFEIPNPLNLIPSVFGTQTDVEGSLKNLLAMCKTRPAKEGTLDAATIASAFNQSFNYKTLWVFGGTDDTLWREQADIMKKGNMDDLCNINSEFENLGYGNFAEELVDELDSEELAELMRTFSTMKYKSDKEAKLRVASTEQQDINWFKQTFPCVFESDSNVDQKVNLNQNNYVYILIKGSSGDQYQLFADGRIKTAAGKSTGKKISCVGSKVTLVAESKQKKKLVEQFDDSELRGGSGGQGGTIPPQPGPKPAPTFTDCQGVYRKGCKSDVIKKVQGCLGGLTQDGKFGSKTEEKLKEKFPDLNGVFRDSEVDKICQTSSDEPVRDDKPIPVGDGGDQPIAVD